MQAAHYLITADVLTPWHFYATSTSARPPSLTKNKSHREGKSCLQSLNGAIDPGHALLHAASTARNSEHVKGSRRRRGLEMIVSAIADTDEADGIYTYTILMVRAVWEVPVRASLLSIHLIYRV